MLLVLTFTIATGPMFYPRWISMFPICVSWLLVNPQLSLNLHVCRWKHHNHIYIHIYIHMHIYMHIWWANKPVVYSECLRLGYTCVYTYIHTYIYISLPSNIKATSMYSDDQSWNYTSMYYHFSCVSRTCIASPI